VIIKGNSEREMDWWPTTEEADNWLETLRCDSRSPDVVMYRWFKNKGYECLFKLNTDLQNVQTTGRCNNFILSSFLPFFLSSFLSFFPSFLLSTQFFCNKRVEESRCFTTRNVCLNKQVRSVNETLTKESSLLHN